MPMKLELGHELGDIGDRSGCRYLDTQPQQPGNLDMLPYGQFNRHVRYLTPSLPNTNLSYTPLVHDPGFNEAEALLGQHYENFTSSPNRSNPIVPGFLHLPQSQPNASMNPFLFVLNQHMLRREHYFQHSHTPSQIPVMETWNPLDSPEIMSATTSPPQLSYSPSNDQQCSGTVWHQHTPEYHAIDREEHRPTVKKTCNIAEEDEGIYDKPYAQLIYDALMQAPGHRMLLREIYEWFIRNTCKPQISGTDGWQNSIRHNLSMNHAFENDKNGPSATRGTRKANSIWFLTPHAIKHGVESTTRYRKSNASKKRAPNRAPAIQRQKSGAKGGRAARRVALRRRQEQNRSTINTPELNTNTPAYCAVSPGPLSTIQDERSTYGFSPVTPNRFDELSVPYSLPGYSYYEYDQEMVPKPDAGGYAGEDEQIQHDFWPSEDYDANI